MGNDDTPTYTFHHNNGEFTEHVLAPGEYVRMTAASIAIVHKELGARRAHGRTVYPFVSIKSWHVSYPNTCPEHGSLSACTEQGLHPEKIEQFSVDEVSQAYDQGWINARRAETTANNRMLYGWLEEAGMCKGPWDPGDCKIKPTLHTRHDFKPRKPGLRIADESIDEVRRVTEQLAEELEKQDEQSNPFRVDTRLDGPEVGRLGDVPERKPVDGQWPDGGPPVGAF